MKRVYYHGSPWKLEELKPHIDPRTNIYGLFLSTDKVYPTLFSLLEHPYLCKIDYKTEDGELTEGIVKLPPLTVRNPHYNGLPSPSPLNQPYFNYYPLNTEGYLYTLVIDDSKVYYGDVIFTQESIVPYSVTKTTREDITQWNFLSADSKGDYNKVTLDQVYHV